MTKKPLLFPCAVSCALMLSLLWAIPIPLAAQSTSPAGKKPGDTESQFVKSLGVVSIDSEQNVITPSGIVYTSAHLHAENGTTLDCHELKEEMDKSGDPTQFVATGNVVAHVPFAKNQTYDISADSAVYDPYTHEINLAGKPVTATAETPYTKGPVVQTGDSGVVVLGPSPNYPKINDFPTILMNNVHTQFTPMEQPGRTTHADSRQEPG